MRGGEKSTPMCSFCCRPAFRSPAWPLPAAVRSGRPPAAASPPACRSRACRWWPLPRAARPLRGRSGRPGPGSAAARQSRRRAGAAQSGPPSPD